ncbi:putative nuclease HARBI1 [Ctenocephalides felis]|uniref:putative nuclease HARBI1 n=1 Tax=Ctenocephalides felis TaxID=7515 RepID=UPI000E6E2F27|nr:putative nuclease HARBI1 [Ctenocephalides felis]
MEYPFYLQVLAAIHFFGHGSYQTDVGNCHLNSMSQPSVSRCIKTVTDLIIKHATPKYVNFPKTSSERDENKKRKGYYSINIEVICDADERILFASSRYPGSTHDAAIWKVSTVRALLTHNADDGTYLLDSGYPLEHCLLTPYRTPVGSTQEKYNKFHKKTRNVIERTFGVVKSRFRRLHRHRTLHYTPDVAGKIVYAVFTLHNICRVNNIPLDEELTEYSDDFGNG